jgi:DNA-directed RNA polymerase subunit RPC12/RpoP
MTDSERAEVEGGALGVYIRDFRDNRIFICVECMTDNDWESVEKEDIVWTEDEQLEDNGKPLRCADCGKEFFIQGKERFGDGERIRKD